MERSTELLKATLDLLSKIDDSCLGDALAFTAFYDGTDCDGACLMDDIENYLEEER